MQPIRLSLGGSKASGSGTKLSLKSKSAKSAVKPSVFGQQGTQEDDDDDDDEDDRNAAGGQAGKGKSKAKPGAPPSAAATTLSRKERLQREEQLKLDQTVFEYDEVYDNMKAGERQAELEKRKEAGDRKPKYITKLIETAEVRKRDRLRAEDKMVQREREREGDEYADKDQFVTPAYLAQQEELRKIEEEEKRKEEENAKKPGGMTAFYKSYLDANEKVHEQAVAASLSNGASSSSGPAAAAAAVGPSFNVAPPPKEKSEAEIAQEFEESTGKKVEVNDDGQIVDKRQLLSGGLNLVKKKPGAAGPGTGGGGFSASIAERKDAGHDSGLNPSNLVAPGMSKAERARQARERHSREVERQMVALEEKRKREAEEQMQQKVQKLARRNDETRVERLKREAEERRKKREEEAKAAGQ